MNAAAKIDRKPLLDRIQIVDGRQTPIDQVDPVDTDESEDGRKDQRRRKADHDAVNDTRLLYCRKHGLFLA
jgi:hypothetical protein